jgi:hypothetical protein
MAEGKPLLPLSFFLCFFGVQLCKPLADRDPTMELGKLVCMSSAFLFLLP